MEDKYDLLIVLIPFIHRGCAARDEQRLICMDRYVGLALAITSTMAIGMYHGDPLASVMDIIKLIMPIAQVPVL